MNPMCGTSILRIVWILCILMVCGGSRAVAQTDVESVFVELYYLSDANDATDVTGGTLVEGSRTYRVFIDLCDSCALRALYGSVGHPFVLQATAPFFNNIDRGRTFGHLINNGALDEQTTALDSWLSIGAASNQRAGVLKEDDTDGSIVGGVQNDGGSAMIPGGLLVNDVPDMGFALTDRDGLSPSPSSPLFPPNFNVIGDDPTSVFNDQTLSNEFISEDFRMGCSTPGVKGPTPENRVLVAQLTTAGELEFELNVEVERPDGTVARYVARDTLLTDGEIPNGLLRYPPECGCTDPDFLEYDPSAGCDNGSCATAIVFGCLDPEACNFSTTANFNIPQLCCYSAENCNGLDIALLCPQLGIDTDGSDEQGLKVHPNPTHGPLVIPGPFLPVRSGTIHVTDIAGRVVHSVVFDGGHGRDRIAIDISMLPGGTYLLRWDSPGTTRIHRVVKE